MQLISSSSICLSLSFSFLRQETWSPHRSRRLLCVRFWSFLTYQRLILQHYMNDGIRTELFLRCQNCDQYWCRCYLRNWSLGIIDDGLWYWWCLRLRLLIQEERDYDDELLRYDGHSWIMQFGLMKFSFYSISTMISWLAKVHTCQSWLLDVRSLAFRERFVHVTAEYVFRWLVRLWSSLLISRT